MHATQPPRSPEEAVMMLLMQARRRLHTRHPEDQLDPAYFPLAKVLMEVEGLRLSDLATMLELDASTVSRQIKQLEDKGLVIRTTDPADGRASLVQLTDTGRDMFKAAWQRRFARITDVLAPWSDHDRALLQDLLTRLATDLAAANEAASGHPEHVRSTR